MLEICIFWMHEWKKDAETEWNKILREVVPVVYSVTHTELKVISSSSTILDVVLTSSLLLRGTVHYSELLQWYGVLICAIRTTIRVSLIILLLIEWINQFHFVVVVDGRARTEPFQPSTQVQRSTVRTASNNNVKDFISIYRLTIDAPFTEAL
jgi:hypothetical protein